MAARVEGALEARRILEGRGNLVHGLLDRQVEASWRRCVAAGLDPRHVPPVRALDPSGLRDHLEGCAPVARLARIEMETLYHQIAGSNFMIAFGDPDGVVIDTIADPAFAASSAGRQIQPGTLWSETLAGTNALGTASATGESLIVHGAEHYFACFDAITCAAAPIHHHDGRLAGVLDASSFCDAYPAHTLVLVRMAALNVGNGLFRQEMARHLMLEIHPRGEFIGSIAAGLLAIDTDGILRGINVQASLLMPGANLRLGQRFEDIFLEGFGAVFDRLVGEHQTQVRDRLDRAYSLAWRNRSSVRGRSQALRLPQVPAGAADDPAAMTAARGAGRLSGAMPDPRPPAPSGLVTGDARLRECMALVEAAARLPSQILICGETGTGKEMLARHAHRSSGRSGEFVAVNCAAMPAELFESELFGYAPGAFTGAQREGRPGLLAAADQGTLLLDEVADLPLPMQAALLRFLDDFQVRPVGGRTARRVDALVIAACHADLERAVAERRFRADLWYRLNTVQVCLPPLRERTDFADLARTLLAGIDAEATLSDAALAVLARQAWPGNVRELRAALTRARLRAGQGPIDVPHLGVACHAPDGGAAAATPASLRVLNSELVMRTLRQLDGNVSATASRLEISRNTVYRYLREQGHA